MNTFKTAQTIIKQTARAAGRVACSRICGRTSCAVALPIPLEAPVIRTVFLIFGYQTFRYCYELA
jgi:hypothetical protein